MGDDVIFLESEYARIQNWKRDIAGFLEPVMATESPALFLDNAFLFAVITITNL